MVKDERKMLSEDWIKEYEKVVITKKIHRVAESIGKARLIIHGYTKIQEKKEALLACIAALEALINSIPILERERKKIDEWQAKIREYSRLIECHPTLTKKYGIDVKVYRDGMQYVLLPSYEGMDRILDLLDDLMKEINLWTTEKGLRITLPIKRKMGVSSILADEGIDLVDIE